MTLLELPGGFLIPLEWVIAVLVAISAPLILLVVMLVLYLRKDTSGPDQEDLAALVPVDEHDTIQEGLLIGGVEKSEDELYLKNPEWTEKDEDSLTGSIVDVVQKVPFPLRDGSGKRKRLWILRDKGSIDCVSASTIVSEKIPKRWDLPIIDWRRLMRHLEGPRTGNSISNLLSSRTGILTTFGLLGFGMLLSFFMITISGHLH